MTPHPVRDARRDEYPRVGEVCVLAYAPSGLPPGHWYWRDLADTAARAADSEVWVAVAGDEVVGTVTWCPPGSAHREISLPGEAEFRMLAVDPAHQGRGVGSALLAAVLVRARSEGCTAVVLSSASWMTAAHAIYERAGFLRTPRLDWTPTPGVTLRTYRFPLA